MRFEAKLKRELSKEKDDFEGNNKVKGEASDVNLLKEVSNVKKVKGVSEGSTPVIYKINAELVKLDKVKASSKNTSYIKAKEDDSAHKKGSASAHDLYDAAVEKKYNDMVNKI